MAFGFGFGLPRGAAAPFSPASLFSTGEQGAWYDPSNFVAGWRTNLLTYSQQFDNAAWNKTEVYIQTNLLTYSEQFNNAVWENNSNGILVTANQIIAPDGTLTGDFIYDNPATINSPWIEQPVTAVGGVSYTFTVYIHSSSTASSGFIYLWDNVGGRGTTQAITLPIQGWNRISITKTLTAGATQARAGIEISSGASTGYYVWGAQLVQGSDAGNYQVTTSATAATQYPAPNGTNTAELLVTYPTTANPNIFWATTNVYQNIPVTFSVYVKANTSSEAQLSLYLNGVGSINQVGQIISGPGSIDSSSSTQIRFYGLSTTQWTRVSVTGTASSSGGNMAAYIKNRITGATVGDSVYIWGAQLEVGSSATAYQQIVTPAISYLNYQALPVMYQDSAGTTPITAVEQPVGLLLDQRQGPTLGSELIANGDFSSTSLTGWTFTNCTGAVVNGQLQLTSTAASGSMTATYACTITEGTYRLLVSVPQMVNTATIYIGGASIAVLTTGDKSYISYTSTAGAGVAYQFGISAIGQIAIIDNLSVKSLIGNHATASGTARPTLSAKYNLLTYTEDFSNAAWEQRNVTITSNTIAAPNGTLTADKIVENTTAGVQHLVSQAVAVLSTTSGLSYTYSMYVKAAEWTSLQLQICAGGPIGQFDFSAVTATPSNGATSATITSVGNGWYRCVVVGASNGTGFVYAYKTSATYTGDGTSGIYIWGADLRVTNDGVNLPVYQRVNASTDYATTGFPLYLLFSGAQGMSTPASIPFATVTSDGQATRNLLTYPTQFDNAVWSKGNATVTTNSTTAPDGSNTADTIVENTAASVGHYLSQASAATGNLFTFSVYVKANGRNWVQLDNYTTGDKYVYFDIANGVVGSKDASGTTEGTITNVGNGWFRCAMKFVPADNTTAGTCFVFTATADGTRSYTGDGTSGIYIWGAQLEVGSTATAFQNIGTDQVTLWAGARSAVVAAGAVIAELGTTDSYSTNGTFGLFWYYSSILQYAFRSRGTAVVDIQGPVYTDAQTKVVTGAASISTPSNTLRVNSSQVATSSATQGTGNYTTYPLCIGARNLTLLPYTGRIYSLIVRGVASNASQISSTEGWVNIKTAAY